MGGDHGDSEEGAVPRDRLKEALKELGNRAAQEGEGRATHGQLQGSVPGGRRVNASGQKQPSVEREQT